MGRVELGGVAESVQAGVGPPLPHPILCVRPHGLTRRCSNQTLLGSLPYLGEAKEAFGLPRTQQPLRPVPQFKPEGCSF